jgi:hypothetical protein
LGWRDIHRELIDRRRVKVQVGGHKHLLGVGSNEASGDGKTIALY